MVLVLRVASFVRGRLWQSLHPAVAHVDHVFGVDHEHLLAERVLSRDQGRDSSLSLVEVLAKVTLVPSVPFKLISDEYPKRTFVPVCLILLA